MQIETSLTLFQVTDLIRFAARKRDTATSDKSYWNMVTEELHSIARQIEGTEHARSTPPATAAT